MAKTILLIAGHKNITTLTDEGLRSWRSVTELRKSTGASGERDWIWNLLTPKLSERLIAKGYEIYITDAVYHADTYNRDYDLCLALHYDAGGTDSRCMISNPNENITPSYIYPESHVRAKQFIQNWLAVYPTQTGIASRQDRITQGMTDYYCWDFVKEGTPAVIIEHGNNTCEYDHDKMFNHADLIADATVEAVERYFNPVVVDGDNYYWVYYKGAKLTPSYETNPKDTITTLETTVTDLNRQLGSKATEVANLRDAIDKQDAYEKQLIIERDLARRERDNQQVEYERQLTDLKAQYKKDTVEMEQISADKIQALEKAVQSLTETNTKLSSKVTTLQAKVDEGIRKFTRWELLKELLRRTRK